MKRGQYTYSQVVNQLKYEMTQDSSEANRISLATRFSDFIYVERWHNLCLDNQIFCANAVKDLFNLTVDQAVTLQQNIVRAYKIADDMLALPEVIQNTHITVSTIINANILNTTIPKIKPTIDIPEVPNIPTGHTAAQKLVGDTKQVMSYMNNEAGQCWGSNALHGKKVIDISNTNSNNMDLQNLSMTLRSYNFDLDAIVLKNNNVGDYAIAALMNGITSQNHQTLYSAASGWKPFTSPLKVAQSVVFLNLANTNIGDEAAKYICEALMSGKLPATRVVDVHNNDISHNKYFIQTAKNIQQPIKIIVGTITNGLQKQGTLIAGSKEAKQAVVKSILKQSQDNGVDVKNVTISKDIWAFKVTTEF